MSAIRQPQAMSSSGSGGFLVWEVAVDNGGFPVIGNPDPIAKKLRRFPPILLISAFRFAELAVDCSPPGKVG
jgi:hypothetical protein